MMQRDYELLEVSLNELEKGICHRLYKLSSVPITLVIQSRADLKRDYKKKMEGFLELLKRRICD